MGSVLNETLHFSAEEVPSSNDPKVSKVFDRSPPTPNFLSAPINRKLSFNFDFDFGSDFDEMPDLQNGRKVSDEAGGSGKPKPGLDSVSESSSMDLDSNAGAHLSSHELEASVQLNPLPASPPSHPDSGQRSGDSSRTGQRQPEAFDRVGGSRRHQLDSDLGSRDDLQWHVSIMDLVDRRDDNLGCKSAQKRPPTPAFRSASLSMGIEHSFVHLGKKHS